MAAELTRLIHKIEIQLHLVAKNCTICCSRVRRPVRKLLDKPSYALGEEKTYKLATCFWINIQRRIQFGWCLWPAVTHKGLCRPPTRGGDRSIHGLTLQNFTRSFLGRSSQGCFVAEVWMATVILLILRTLWKCSFSAGNSFSYWSDRDGPWVWGWIFVPKI
jgi:hypothetical protein